MSLSLKAELEVWATALNAYDKQDFEKALDLFSRIRESSKILTNIGLIYATIGEHETAVDHFVAATNLDSYLAIAHFQCGVSNFLLQRYDLALLNFEDAYLYLRGNEAINYEQLGLKFKLFAAEIVFNKGLSQLNFGYIEEGMADLQEASKLKLTDEHSVIDEAIRDRGNGYTVFSIPVGVLYRPSENKLKNSKSKDYLGKARLVAASDADDAFTEFTGIVKMQRGPIESTDNKEDEKETKPDAESSMQSRSKTVPVPRTDPTALRPAIIERSKTALQLDAGVRLDAVTILTSRRSQSISDPTNIPQPSAPDPSRSNTAVCRINTTRLERRAGTGTGVMDLRVRTPQDTAGILYGRSVVNSKSGGDIGTATCRTPAILRNPPSPQKPRGQQASEAAQRSPPQPPPLSIQSGRSVNATQGIIPLVSPLQDGHRDLTQFYETYMDAYTDDQALRSAITRSPTVQTQSASSSQRQSPASSPLYHQPRPQPHDQRQLHTRMQSAESPVRTSSNTSMNSGISRIPLRAVNASMPHPNSNTGMGMGQNTGTGMGNTSMRGGLNHAGGGSLQRKMVHRPTTRYDHEEGDDGFVTGEYEEYEIMMAKIRVRLHYHGDVRGMTISPAMSFSDFVERVTTKFGTSMTGLGIKFMDEDGTRISLRDESDFELAIETARESTRGRSEGKIEVWCVDV